MVGAKSISQGLAKCGLIKPSDVPKIMKMLRALSDICYEELFKGKTVKLPGYLGILRIYREMPKIPHFLPNHRKRFMPGHEYDINKKAYNPKTGGYVYSFRVTGKDFEDLQIKIRMGERFRKRLFDELYHKDFGNII
jgi:hypothetical protein